MKNIIMAFFFILNLNLVYGEDPSNNQPSANTPEEEKSERDTLKKAMDLLLEQEFTRSAREQCKDQKTDFGSCVFSKLNKDDKEKAYKIIDEVKAADAQAATMPSKYESRSLGKVESYKDPVINQLAGKLSDQFREAIYGELTAEQKKQRLQIIDPSVFHRIYKSQLSKNLILKSCVKLNSKQN